MSRHAEIDDYALPGDLHTAALVSAAGSIDWLCLPRFDSPSAFAALLDHDDKGHWTLAPAAGGRCATRRYAGSTLVLETDWVTGGGAVRVIDFMPPRADTPHVVRIAVGLDGEVPMRSVLRLRFDYGREVPWIRRLGSEVHAIAGPNRVRLISAVPAVRRELSQDGLVKRYQTSQTNDGLKGSEGLFIACSFWLVDALSAAGQRRDAIDLFERLLGLRNDVGLLSEEWDPAARRQLGNTPQAFSHFALVVSALQLHMGHAVRSDNPMQA